ncbi:hypothetical protein EJ05DRAFT_499212 [Pseudovirgaria hyperparasitica]|uniref:Uncharacterized protein n=1 Tax=Pseudovirgaria hyperparasitica TaxID=470096 RepID=A0A6A6WBG5_9PEZI|nr:uncharacterized protein EJ05DRAFT_499212 [Pseudovirgaria hyperparasitica]KAF2760023.1 hypothetical protein EJ05DRAFT_499212 [Pseudovirgaria hyperparasitica]
MNVFHFCISLLAAFTLGIAAPLPGPEQHVQIRQGQGDPIVIIPLISTVITSVIPGGTFDTPGGGKTVVQDPVTVLITTRIPFTPSAAPPPAVAPTSAAAQRPSSVAQSSMAVPSSSLPSPSSLVSSAASSAAVAVSSIPQTPQPKPTPTPTPSSNALTPIGTIFVHETEFVTVPASTPSPLSSAVSKGASDLALSSKIILVTEVTTVQVTNPGPTPPSSNIKTPDLAPTPSPPSSSSPNEQLLAPPPPFTYVPAGTPDAPSPASSIPQTPLQSSTAKATPSPASSILQPPVPSSAAPPPQPPPPTPPQPPPPTPPIQSPTKPPSAPPVILTPKPDLSVVYVTVTEPAKTVTETIIIVQAPG